MAGSTTEAARQTVIELEQIIIDRRFQVRNRMDGQTVKAYANAMSSGSEFPPIKLGEIGGRLFLIDGFHRYEAARSIGRYWLEADIVPMTEREALKASALANLTHGRQLTKTEKLNAFKQFIKGGGHKKECGRLKSYREIATELHGIGGHTTIRNWMMKHFPRIARQYGDDKPGNRGADIPKINPEAERASAIVGALSEALALFDLVSDPEEVFRIRQEVTKLASAVNQKEAREPDF